MDDDRPAQDRPERDSRGSDKQERPSDAAAWMQSLRDIAPYLDLGWRLAGTAAFPPLIGAALDAWLGTTPWILLAGCVVGLAGAVVQLKRLQEEFGN